MARKKNPEPNEDVVSRLSDRNQHILSLSILFLLPIILFYSTVLGDQQFMASDTIQWRAGAESVFDYRAEFDGEEPLWSTHMFGGMPAYVIHVSKSVPHLDNMIFDQLRFIWPAVQYWVLLAGCYLFFILQGFRPLTSAMGAVFIGFTTYIPIIIGAGHNIKFIAYSYIPWMLSGYWMTTRGDKRWWGFFLFAVATTLGFRAGHPQVIYYFIYLFLALYLFDTWTNWKAKKIADWGKVTGLLTLAVVLAFLGSAEQYLRLMEYSPHSIRGGSAIAQTATESGLTIEYAFRWSQGFMETFTLLIPNLFGGDSGLAYWGDKILGTGGPHYFGAVAGLFFIIALFRTRKKIMFVFLGTGLLAMTFAWGRHFPLNELWFNILPGFDKFRTPEMWLIVTVFCFSVVSLHGLESCFGLVREGKNGLKKLYTPVAVTLGIGLIFLIFGTSILSFENDREKDYIAQQLASQNNLSPDNAQVLQQTDRIIEAQFKPERIELARADSIRYLLIAGVATALVLLFLNLKIGIGLFVLFLVVLSSFDMLSVGQRYINDQSYVPAGFDLTDVLEQQRRPVDQFLEERVQDSSGFQWRVLPLDGDPFNNAIPNYFYPTFGGYTGAKLSITQDVIDSGLFTGPAGINMPMLDMLNIRYISSQQPLPLQGYTEVFSEENSYVYENENVLPKAWFVDSVQVVLSPEEAFNEILPQQNFNPRTTAIVEMPLMTTSMPDSLAAVDVETYNARHLAFSVERTTPGFLVISEIYYPEGWTARLDGEEVPIYKTNYLLRGVEIPAGEHTLELTFDPQSHRIGSAVSWASNLIQWGIGLVLLVGYIRKYNRGDAEDTEKGL